MKLPLEGKGAPKGRAHKREDSFKQAGLSPGKEVQMIIAIETPTMYDEGRAVASRLTDKWVLFVSDSTGQKVWINPVITLIHWGA